MARLRWITAICFMTSAALSLNEEIIQRKYFEKSLNGQRLYPRMKRQSQCNRTEWPCQDGTCIALQKKCDGIRHCPDSSDETFIACQQAGSTQKKCVLPPYPEHGSYIVANHSNAKPGQVYNFVFVDYTCDEGYRIAAKGSIFCYNGFWSDEPPKCQELCRLNPHPSVDYQCRVSGSYTGTRPCKLYEPSGTEVVPKCRTQNYYLNQMFPRMRCTDGKWNYVATCLPDCGKIVPSGTTLVVEGKYIEKLEVPWHVGVYGKETGKKQQEYRQICGGSIITTSHVLSVAHCFGRYAKDGQSISQYAVAGGKLYRDWNDPRDENVQKSEIENIKIPTTYLHEEGLYNNDIALVFLRTPFVYSLYVRPVCLDFDVEFDKKQLTPGNLGFIAGWGRTSKDSDDTLILKLVESPYKDINSCRAEVKKNFKPYITPDKICVSNSIGGVICKGDSGNGFSFPEIEGGERRYYLRGLISTSQISETATATAGTICNSDIIILFTHTLTHENFIKENITVEEHRRHVTQQSTCRLPPLPEHGSYTVVNNLGFMPGDFIDSFYLEYECDDGYAILGSRELFCVNGHQPKEAPKCEKLCALHPHPSVEYLCHEPQSYGKTRECGLYEPEGTLVTPKCRTPNYDTSQYLRDMKCSNGTWDYIAKCSAVCGTVTPQGDILVAGGRNSEKGEVPWHVGVYDKQFTPFKHICGGSIVSSDLVVTAAHCFWNHIEGAPKPASRFSVAAGKLYRGWEDPRDLLVQKSDVVQIEIPDTFRGTRTNYQDDIALVLLFTKLVYDVHIRPVCLDFNILKEKRQLASGNLGKVAGWGLIDEEGAKTQTLQVANLPYIDVKQCLDEAPPEFNEYITGDKICAGYVNGTALCEGDSGGGLTFSEVYGGERRYYLRGVVSTAPTNNKTCNVYAVTTFTQMQRHELFLKRHYVGP